VCSSVLLGLLDLSHRLLHRRQHVVIRWESVQVFLRHHLLADPDRELPTAALDQLRIDSSLLLDERRRTGSAWTIVSNPAESNADALHDIDSLADSRALARPESSVYAARANRMLRFFRRRTG
jgi:hypothetical protein